ncbi:MAG: hypothetical protein Q8N47_07020, partial [Bryobacterales bacterium]|nr:hypothetical protein [Bryobacterales bacterium]
MDFSVNTPRELLRTLPGDDVRRPGTGACTLASAMQLWLWTRTYLQHASDAHGVRLYQSARQGVSFALAHALRFLLASRCQTAVSTTAMVPPNLPFDSYAGACSCRRAHNQFVLDAQRRDKMLAHRPPGAPGVARGDAFQDAHVRGH